MTRSDQFGLRRPTSGATDVPCMANCKRKPAMARNFDYCGEPASMTINQTMRTRALASPASDLDTDARTVSLSFSSENAVDMGYGVRETLSHAPGSMVNGARQKHMPLLLNHNPSDILGTVERIAIGADRK